MPSDWLMMEALLRAAPGVCLRRGKLGSDKRAFHHAREERTMEWVELLGRCLKTNKAEGASKCQNVWARLCGIWLKRGNVGTADQPRLRTSSGSGEDWPG
jgi:hypothetical protein